MSVVIWRFTDAKPGHDRQSQGLVQALQGRLEVSEFGIPVRRYGNGWWCWMTAACRYGRELPAPDLLIGAGHGTHLHMLAARRRYGGRIIVLMKPSLPMSWFDLCVVPGHDRVPVRANLLSTVGALNRIRPGRSRDPARGLIVLGGPSRHYRWNDETMLEQLEALLRSRPVDEWVLTSSPRTPLRLERKLASLSGIEYRPFAETERAWLEDSMRQAGEVWVSEDSVSLVYEALTSGADVGLLRVPRARQNRITRGVDELVARGWVGEPGKWVPGQAPGQPLDEAGRCAEWIMQNWLSAD